MSIWHEAKTEDIDLDEKQQEVDIFVDIQGIDDSVYVTLTYTQIIDVYKQIVGQVNRENE